MLLLLGCATTLEHCKDARSEDLREKITDKQLEKAQEVLHLSSVSIGQGLLCHIHKNM